MFGDKSTQKKPEIALVRNRLQKSVKVRKLLSQTVEEAKKMGSSTVCDRIE